MNYIYFFANLGVAILITAIVIFVGAIYLIIPAIKKNRTVEKHRNSNFAHRGLHNLQNGIPENKSGKTGFVFNGTDPILLSVLMAELCQNQKLRKEMGISARKKIKKTRSLLTQPRRQS